MSWKRLLAYAFVMLITACIAWHWIESLDYMRTRNTYLYVFLQTLVVALLASLVCTYLSKSNIFLQLICYFVVGHFACVFVEFFWQSFFEPQKLEHLFKNLSKFDAFSVLGLMILPGVTLGGVQSVVFGLFAYGFRSRGKTP